jgi:hypothetical protein
MENLVNILDSFQSGWKAWLAGLPVPLMYMGKNALWDESKYKKEAVVRQQEENPQDVVVSSFLPESK